MEDGINTEQSQAQQILLKYQHLQNQLLFELSQCLAHKDHGRCDRNEGKSTDCAERNNDQSEAEVKGRGRRRRDKFSCPECSKQFNAWKTLLRHYHIRMFDGVSFYQLISYCYRRRVL